MTKLLRRQFINSAPTIKRKEKLNGEVSIEHLIKYGDRDHLIGQKFSTDIEDYKRVTLRDELR